MSRHLNEPELWNLIGLVSTRAKRVRSTPERNLRSALFFAMAGALARSRHEFDVRYNLSYIRARCLAIRGGAPLDASFLIDTAFYLAQGVASSHGRVVARAFADVLAAEWKNLDVDARQTIKRPLQHIRSLNLTVREWHLFFEEPIPTFVERNDGASISP